MMKHIKYICNCQIVGCQFCDGGLFACSVCGCLEGSLPTDCPGIECYKEYGEKIYAGLIDYRNGSWINEPSVNSPAYYRKKGQK